MVLKQYDRRLNFEGSIYTEKVGSVSSEKVGSVWSEKRGSVSVKFPVIPVIGIFLVGNHFGKE